MDASWLALIVVLVVSALLFAWLAWRLRREEFPGGRSWIDLFVERVRRQWPWLWDAARQPTCRATPKPE